MKAFTELQRNLCFSSLAASNYQIAVTFQRCLPWVEGSSYWWSESGINSHGDPVVHLCKLAVLLLDTEFFCPQSNIGLRELKHSLPPGTYITVGGKRTQGIWWQTDTSTPIFCPPYSKTARVKCMHVLCSSFPLNLSESTPFRTQLSTKTASVRITSGFQVKNRVSSQSSLTGLVVIIWSRWSFSTPSSAASSGFAST